MVAKKRRKRTVAPNQGSAKSTRREEPVEASARYTPPRRFSYIFRPTWHTVPAFALLLVGFSLFFACELSLANIHSFGGHIVGAPWSGGI